MSNERTGIIPYSEFLKNSRKPQVRPAVWKWRDIHPKLVESISEDFLEAGRGTQSLVHSDTGELHSVSPTMNVVVQIFKPGEHNKAHRHTNVALNIVFKGQGYSIVDGEKLEWEAGDVFLAPPWSAHEHCNTSETEDAILYTVQDVPVVSGMGVWFLEEPIGSPSRHIVLSQNK